ALADKAPGQDFGDPFARLARVLADDDARRAVPGSQPVAHRLADDLHRAAVERILARDPANAIRAEQLPLATHRVRLTHRLLPAPAFGVATATRTALASRLRRNSEGTTSTTSTPCGARICEGLRR